MFRFYTNIFNRRTYFFIMNGLELIGDERTRILILGSFPGNESILRGRYYSSKSNDFWKILSEMYSVDFCFNSYEDNVKFLLDKGIGMWDIYSSCEREGSLDKNIINYEFNDFSTLKCALPNLEKICFNGKRAYLSNTFFSEYEICVLPSSSGANRKNQERRISEWKKELI